MRWAVVSFAVAVLLISILGLFRYPDYAARHLEEFTPHYQWTGGQVQKALAELGWSPLTAAWFDLGRNLLGLLVVYSISAAILWKKSRDWFGLFLTAVFIIQGSISGNLFKPVIEILPGLTIVNEIFGAVGWQLFFLLFFFFPNGRPVPAWAGWFVAGYSVFMLAALKFEGLSSPVGSIAGPSMVILAIGSQIYRYIRRADPVQRQQTKWVVIVLGFFLLLIPFGYLFGFQAPPPGSLGPALIKDYSFLTLLHLVFWLAPAAIAMAVLRYRLWDIDLIIRRTLLYALLSGLLGLVYFGSVLLLRQVLGGLTGESSAALVISTLLMAALFSPLRRRLQAAIDRRFYRQKYDAARALEGFSVVVRNEVELQALSESLAAVVNAAIQPQNIGLWIKPVLQLPSVRAYERLSIEREMLESP